MLAIRGKVNTPLRHLCRVYVNLSAYSALIAYFITHAVHN